MRFSALLAALLLGACSAAPHAWHSPHNEFALAALADNIAATDLSARVRVTGHRVRTDSTALSGSEEVLVVEQTAEVVETYRGAELEQLTYLQFIDRQEGLEGFGPGEVIVSLCHDDQAGHYYLPDIGFEVPAAAELIERAQAIRNTLRFEDDEIVSGDRSACR